MDQKLPYYMAYPTPLLYDDERRERMDFEYMKSMYPDAAKQLLPYIEDECDRVAYEGSVMFDEYPDKTGVEQIAARIYDKAKYLENFFMPVYEEDEVFEASKHCTSCRGQDNWLKNLIQVVLLGEMNYRRQRYYQKKSKK